MHMTWRMLKAPLPCRPDKITLQGLDMMAPDDNIAGGRSWEDALQAMDATDNPVVNASHKPAAFSHSCLVA